MKTGVIFRVIKAYPAIDKIFITIVKMIPAAAETIKKLENDTKDKTLRRISAKTDRKDFIRYQSIVQLSMDNAKYHSHFLRHNNDEKGGVSTEEIISNAGLFIIAGSETSATLLSGMFFHLLKNPDYMAKLKKEVRSSFTSTEDMTFASQTKLPYLQACIEEALRIYPPVPADLPRVTPPEGAIINGEVIPGNVCLPFNILRLSSRTNWLLTHRILGIGRSSPLWDVSLREELQECLFLSTRALARRSCICKR